MNNSCPEKCIDGIGDVIKAIKDGYIKGGETPNCQKIVEDERYTQIKSIRTCEKCIKNKMCQKAAIAAFDKLK